MNKDGYMSKKMIWNKSCEKIGKGKMSAMNYIQAYDDKEETSYWINLDLVTDIQFFSGSEDEPSNVIFSLPCERKLYIDINEERYFDEFVSRLADKVGIAI